MTKHAAIIAAFQDAPETWTTEQLKMIEKKTGESIDRQELRAAFSANNSPVINHLKTALSESISAARALDFSGRLRLLCAEIIPAAEMIEQQKKRLETMAAEEQKSE